MIAAAGGRRARHTGQGMKCTRAPGRAWARSPRPWPLRSGHVAPGAAQDHRVSDPGLVHQRGAHRPARDRADVQPEQPVRVRGVGDRVLPPDPRPARDLDADVLAWPVGQRLVRPQREHGEIGAAQVVPGHLGDPPGRLGGEAARRARHGGADVVQRRLPRGLCLRGPAAVAERPQGAEQSVAERPVMVLGDAVLAVVVGQLGEPAGHGVRPVRGPHAAGQRAEHLGAAAVEGQREHGPQLWIVHKKGGEEIRHDLIGLRFEHGERLLQQPGFRGRHRASGPAVR